MFSLRLQVVSLNYRSLRQRPSLSPEEGGGGTDSLRLGTAKLQPPFFGQGQPLVLPSPNLQPPFFMDTYEQPLEISIKWEFSVLHMSYFSQLLYQQLSRRNLNVNNRINFNLPHVNVEGAYRSIYSHELFLTVRRIVYTRDMQVVSTCENVVHYS